MLARLLVGALLVLTSNVSVNAAVLTYAIPNLVNFSSFQGSSTNDTFNGTGYVGMLSGHGGFRFIEGFGVGINSGVAPENDRTALEVDISALNGKIINSALLQYKIENEFSATPGQIRAINLTAFTANGIVGFFFNPPDNLFSGPAFSVLGENSINVKDFLNAGLMSKTGWFGLHLQGNEGCCWSQGTSADEQPDAAKVRLVVDYAETATVPEPATAALLGIGFLGFAACRQKCPNNWKQ